MTNVSEHWATLVSIIIGLGIADLLLGLLGLIRARQRVDWDAVPLLWAVIALLWLFNYWWGVAAGLDGSQGVRVVGHYALLAIPPILLFLLSASVLPRELRSDGRIDMRGEWEANRNAFFAIFALNQLATWVIASLALGGIVWNLASVTRTAALILVLACLVVKSRRVEWLALAGIFAMVVARLSTQTVR